MSIFGSAKPFTLPDYPSSRTRRKRVREGPENFAIARKRRAGVTPGITRKFERRKFVEK
jgi:hypothetical protein